MPASDCSAARWPPIADLGVHLGGPRNLLLAGNTISNDTIMSVPAVAARRGVIGGPRLSAAAEPFINNPWMA
jgi:hypothetical protein